MTTKLRWRRFFLQLLGSITISATGFGFHQHQQHFFASNVYTTTPIKIHSCRWHFIKLTNQNDSCKWDRHEWVVRGLGRLWEDEGHVCAHEEQGAQSRILRLQGSVLERSDKEMVLSSEQMLIDSKGTWVCLPEGGRHSTLSSRGFVRINKIGWLYGLKPIQSKFDATAELGWMD